MNLQSRGSLTLQEKNSIEASLKAKGFREVGRTASLSPGQYKITTHSGDASSFGDDIKFNIEWCEST